MILFAEPSKFILSLVVYELFEWLWLLKSNIVDQLIAAPGLATPPPDETTTSDVVSHFNRLISTDPSITPAIAAIDSLIAALQASNLSTISETVTLLDNLSNTLLQSQQNPIPLSAGTELLKRYIITSFKQQPAQLSGSDFTQLRRALITNSKLFVSRTRSARSKIAKHALPFIRDDSTIFAYGASRVIDAILNHAAESNGYFKVIFISSSTWAHSSTDTESTALELSTKRLLAHGIPVASITFPSLSHAVASLPKTGSNTLFLLGAEAVLENGGTVSNIGSHLVATIAKHNGVPCYYAAESYKFTRQFPVSVGDADLQAMGAKQQTVVFKTSLDEDSEMSFEPGKNSGEGMVDITPPELISGLITENGVMTCEGVAEELIKLWF